MKKRQALQGVNGQKIFIVFFILYFTCLHMTIKKTSVNPLNYSYLCTKCLTKKKNKIKGKTIFNVFMNI